MDSNEKLYTAFDTYVQYDLQKWEVVDEQNIDFSTRHMKRMNRLFRECDAGDTIPHPEVDNRYEQIRSRIVRWARKRRR